MNWRKVHYQGLMRRQGTQDRRIGLPKPKWRRRDRRRSITAKPSGLNASTLPPCRYVRDAGNFWVVTDEDGVLTTIGKSYPRHKLELWALQAIGESARRCADEDSPYRNDIALEVLSEMANSD